MFQELHPLLKQRSLTITIAALNGEQIRVNIIPHSRPEDTKANEQIKHSHKDHVAGIPEAPVQSPNHTDFIDRNRGGIDAKLPGVLAIERHHPVRGAARLRTCAVLSRVRQ